MPSPCGRPGLGCPDLALGPLTTTTPPPPEGPDQVQTLSREPPAPPRHRKVVPSQCAPSNVPSQGLVFKTC